MAVKQIPLTDLGKTYTLQANSIVIRLVLTGRVYCYCTTSCFHSPNQFSIMAFHAIDLSMVCPPTEEGVPPGKKPTFIVVFFALILALLLSLHDSHV